MINYPIINFVSDYAIGVSEMKTDVYKLTFIEE